ncbi:MAG: glycine cleavage system protein GcvH [Acidobacteriota bacterium]
MIPEDLKYSREHEWVRVEGGVATVGITDHAQQEMGDLVFVELPTPGDTLEAGQPLGTVESVKAVSEVFSPVSGKVSEVNETLLDHPERINEDPHGEGWIARVTLGTDGVPSDLMDAAGYAAYLDAGGD